MNVLEFAEQFFHDIVEQGWPFQCQQMVRYEIMPKEDDSNLQEALDKTIKAAKEKPWVLEFDLESAERIQAILDEMDHDDPFPRVWLGVDSAPDVSMIEVTRAPMPAKGVSVEIVGASVTSSDTPPYEPDDHKSLIDIELEAEDMVAGLPMVLISGTCRWWTTDIRDCYMERMGNAHSHYSRPCCPHCGEPLVMVPLDNFADNARQYASTFGRLGLRALELAYAHNLGRLMCLTDWDMYADAAEAYERMSCHVD